MSNTWADLFKAKNNDLNPIDSSPQCLHEISNDWICVDEKQNCESVNDLGKHEFLTDDQKERRAQWQKRLQKGRSKNYNSMPSKARFRKNSSNTVQKNCDDTQVQSNNSTSNHTNKSASQDQLRAKLRLAVEAAGSNASVEEPPVSPSFVAHRIKPSGQKNARNCNRGARRNMQPIQQPSQRGMN